jgi:copper chaperone CopZ
VALAGVENIDITVADNKVVVTGAALDSAALVEKVAKSGKATELWA